MQLASNCERCQDAPVSIADNRTYHSPLRDAQAASTRTLILDTLAELIAAANSTDVSVRELAKAANTSERTVYRHFPDRAALFEALVERIADTEGWYIDERSRFRLDSVDALPAAIESAYHDFEATEVHTRVAAILAGSMASPPRNVRERTARVRSFLAEEFDDLDEVDLDELLAVLRLLMSSRTWLWLKREYGIDGDRSGPLSAWVARLVTDEVRRTGRVGDARRSE